MIYCLSSAQHKALAENIFDVGQKLPKSSEDSPSLSFDMVGLWFGSSPPFKDMSPVLLSRRHIL